jgi:hypothetical protein
MCITSADLSTVHFRTSRGCRWCGLSFFEFDPTTFQRGNQHLCLKCRVNLPPRGARVFHGVPDWLGPRFNETLELEVFRFLHRHGEGSRRHRLVGKSETGTFILNALPEYASIFDHSGHSGRTWVHEPYQSASDPEFLALVAGLASRLEVDHAVGRTPSWHRCWDPGCVRVEFFPPGENQP